MSLPVETPALLAAAQRLRDPHSHVPAMTGRQIGKYTIESLIDAGGMGEVYRALDTRLKRAVAIKVLPPAFTGDPARRARFEREARLLSTLNHPHIAQVHGLEEADGVLALVMELVPGQTLAEIIGSGSATSPQPTGAPHSRERFWMAATAVTAVASIAGLVWTFYRLPSPVEEIVQFTVQPPAGHAFPPRPGFLAISPDGRHLAFVTTANGRNQLWVRALDSTSPRLREFGRRHGRAPNSL